MKKNLIILSIVMSIAAIACTKHGDAPGSTVNDNLDTMSIKLEYSGSFVDGPYGTVMGMVKIYADSTGYSLVLDSFKTSNGPDLHVYLSKEVMPIHFIDLGKLKSNNGKQVYQISGSPEFTQYKYALIHCQLFNHLFGSGELK